MRLVKKVLAPFMFGLAHQTQQLPARMEGKRPRRAKGPQAGLFGQPVPLSVVAGMAAAHQVIPIGMAAARARNHMVQRQLRRGKHLAAELARIAVSEEDIFSRKGAGPVVNLPEFQEPDDTWNANRQ